MRSSRRSVKFADDALDLDALERNVLAFEQSIGAISMSRQASAGSLAGAVPGGAPRPQFHSNSSPPSHTPTPLPVTVGESSTASMAPHVRVPPAVPLSLSSFQQLGRSADNSVALAIAAVAAADNPSPRKQSHFASYSPRRHQAPASATADQPSLATSASLSSLSSIVPPTAWSGHLSGPPNPPVSATTPASTSVIPAPSLNSVDGVYTWRGTSRGLQNMNVLCFCAGGMNHGDVSPASPICQCMPGIFAFFHRVSHSS
jgi:hypothetical protein